MVAPIKFERSMGSIVEIKDVKTKCVYHPKSALKTKFVIAVVSCNCQVGSLQRRLSCEATLS